MTKQEKIEKLIQMEWEDFQKVNNEGGRASCQDDPETFFIMRRSHFAPWTEELIDCVLADMNRAHEQGRNLVLEKYAWMMASTAPEQFKKLHHFLIDQTLAGEQWSDAIVKQQLAWMVEYQAKYPVLASGNRLLYSSEDTPYDTSFQTYLLGELRTYSDSTLHTYWQFINDLKKEGKSLALLTMEAEVKAYGYEGLDAAEKALSK